MLVKQYSYILNYIRRKVEGTKVSLTVLSLCCNSWWPKFERGRLQYYSPTLTTLQKLGGRLDLEVRFWRFP